MEIDIVIEKAGDKEKAKLLQRFFKTGKGEYGEGDVFLGIIVPKQREIANEFYGLSLEEIQALLNSEIHEKRMIALIILMHKFKKAEEKEKRIIFEFYLENASRGRINNWDLVDLSCCKIVGEFLLDKDKEILYDLARSNGVWERRIAIISTFTFIREGNFEDTIKIAEMLLKDKHDLIHKAVGWMLREVGKRDESELISFLNKHYKIMPRTMLRYAIEKLPEKDRKMYLKKEI